MPRKPPTEQVQPGWELLREHVVESDTSYAQMTDSERQVFELTLLHQGVPPEYLAAAEDETEMSHPQTGLPGRRKMLVTSRLNTPGKRFERFNVVRFMFKPD